MRPARPSRRRGADHDHRSRLPHPPRALPAPAALRPAPRPVGLAPLRHRPGAHRPRAAGHRRDLGGNHARQRGARALTAPAP
ncbi:hypothetical protein DA075_07345 [Methylobacterium currus]|uniref:Uncharacterized protein n=1 Tax=Methylobacterium currus TaxID=2051553 RepID=A0A2R4WGV0_9HYPH|nr:hypothetical protein DA075_07345 [Methylobacterium currus]